MGGVSLSGSQPLFVGRNTHCAPSQNGSATSIKPPSLSIVKSGEDAIEPMAIHKMIQHTIKGEEGAHVTYSSQFFSVIWQCLSAQVGTSDRIKSAVEQSCALKPHDGLAQTILRLLNDALKPPFLVLPAIGTHNHAAYLLVRILPDNPESIRVTVCNRGARGQNHGCYETWDVPTQNLGTIMSRLSTLSSLSPNAQLDKIAKSSDAADDKVAKFLTWIEPPDPKFLEALKPELKAYFEQPNHNNKPSLSKISIKPSLIYAQIDDLGTHLQSSHRDLSKGQKGGHCVLDNLWAALKLGFVEADSEHGLEQFKSCKVAVRQHLAEVGTPEQKTLIESFEALKKKRKEFDSNLELFKQNPSLPLPESSGVPNRFPNSYSSETSRNLEYLTKALLDMARSDIKVNYKRRAQSFLDVLREKTTEPFVTFRKIIEFDQSDQPLTPTDHLKTLPDLNGLSEEYQKLTSDLSAILNEPDPKLDPKAPAKLKEAKNKKTESINRCNQALLSKEYDILNGLASFYQQQFASLQT